MPPMTVRGSPACTCQQGRESQGLAAPCDAVRARVCVCARVCVRGRALGQVRTCVRACSGWTSTDISPIHIAQLLLLKSLVEGRASSDGQTISTALSYKHLEQQMITLVVIKWYSKPNANRTHQHAGSTCGVHLRVVGGGTVEKGGACAGVVIVGCQVRLIPHLAEARHIELGLVHCKVLHDPLPV